MECRNTILDDISAEIGYTATTVLSAWFGGTLIRVPLNVIPNHPIGHLIGQSAFGRLVGVFGDQDIFIPKNALSARYARWRQVRDMILEGCSTNKVVEETGLSAKQVRNIRHALESYGMLPLILTKPAGNAN